MASFLSFVQVSELVDFDHIEVLIIAAYGGHDLNFLNIEDVGRGIRAGAGKSNLLNPCQVEVGN